MLGAHPDWKPEEAEACAFHGGIVIDSSKECNYSELGRREERAVVKVQDRILLRSSFYPSQVKFQFIIVIIQLSCDKLFTKSDLSLAVSRFHSRCQPLRAQFLLAFIYRGPGWLLYGIPDACYKFGEFCAHLA